MLKKLRTMAISFSPLALAGFVACGSVSMPKSSVIGDEEESLLKRRVTRSTDSQMMLLSAEAQQKDQERLAAIEALPGTALGKFLKSNTLSSEYAFWAYLGDILKETSGFEPVAKTMVNYEGNIEYKVKQLKEGKRFPQAGHKVSTEVAMALAQGEEVYSYHYTRFSRAFYRINGTVFSIKKAGQTDRVLIGTLTVSIDGRDDFTLEFGKGAQYGIVIDQDGVAKRGNISIAHDYGHYHAKKGAYIDGVYHARAEYTKGETSELALEIDKEHDISQLKAGDEGNKMLSLLKLFKISGSEEVAYLW